MKAKPYSTYKDSGHSWPGSFPSHWKLVRNKDIFAERGSLSVAGDETLLTVSHITGVTRRTEKTVNMFMAETMEGYKLCKKGDFIINTMWAWMGALGTANEEGICSPAYGVYQSRRTRPYNHRYFDYLYRTPHAITEMTRNSKGIVSSRLRLYPRDFFRIQTALPGDKEQTAIANYLDTKTAEIDRKIDLLSQKAAQNRKLKQSLITETVTRGLNNSVATKNSDIKWIGNVPAHWGIHRLKEVGFLFSGLTGKSGKDFTDENENSAPFIPFTNIANNFYLSETLLQYVVVFQNEKQNTVKKFDMFFLMSSEDYADLGKCSLLIQEMPSPTYLNSFCKGFRFTKKTIHPPFINYLLHSSNYRVHLSNEGKGFTRINLKMEKINNIRLIVPPYAEQQAITDYLDEKTTNIDSIVSVINDQIVKLKELRKTLINDVVTGKIKVIEESEAA